jgi:hypothetical protein
LVGKRDDPKNDERKAGNRSCFHWTLQSVNWETWP